MTKKESHTFWKAAIEYHKIATNNGKVAKFPTELFPSDIEAGMKEEGVDLCIEVAKRYNDYQRLIDSNRELVNISSQLLEALEQIISLEYESGKSRPYIESIMAITNRAINNNKEKVETYLNK